MRTQDPRRTQDSMKTQDPRRTLGGPRILGGPRTLGGHSMLWEPRTLGGPRILWGSKTLRGPKILWGPKPCIIPPIKCSVWLKYSKILYFILNLWGVNLAFSKTSILYLITTSISRSFHISKLWQSGRHITTFILKSLYSTFTCWKPFSK